MCNDVSTRRGTRSMEDVFLFSSKLSVPWDLLLEEGRGTASRERKTLTGARANPSGQSPLPSLLMKCWFVYEHEMAKRIIAHKAKTVQTTRRMALTCHCGSRSERRRRVSYGIGARAMTVLGVFLLRLLAGAVMY